MNITIGFFDSGMGGVYTAQLVATMIPGINCLVFADRINLPYGEKNPNRIKDRTFSCIETLFACECDLVILACNSASTHAIHARQEKYPDKKVLSVTIPGIEEAIEQGVSSLAVLATKTTIETDLYPMLFKKHYPEYSGTIEQYIGEGLVDAIEKNASVNEVEQLLDALSQKIEQLPDALVLGCTHYPLIKKNIAKCFGGIPCIDPSYESAKKLLPYIKKHFPKHNLSGDVSTNFTVITTARDKSFYDYINDVESKIGKNISIIDFAGDSLSKGSLISLQEKVKVQRYK